MASDIIIDQALLNRFHPLCSIDTTYIDQLSQTSFISTFNKGDLIFKNNANHGLNHFLISGCIEIRESFSERLELDHHHEDSKSCLENACSDSASVKAKTQCKILIINAQTIDQIVASSQCFNYEVVHSFSDPEASNTGIIIDDEQQEDWVSAFTRSPLASNLAASDLHRLLSTLETIDCQRGDKVVNLNSEGDYFYILKSGFAKVFTDDNGPYKGQAFNLEPGDYFGDEAIVANTLRNANVVMAADGQLGKLKAEDFIRLVKSAVVRYRPLDEIDYSEQLQLIDVRLPFEYKLQHHPKSTNIPISHLRGALADFDQTMAYYITPEGGSRSELASYLLRQAGFEAYCLTASRNL